MAQQNESEPNRIKQLLAAQTTKLLSPHLSWQSTQMIKVNYDLVIPIINSINDQNIFMKRQIDNIGKQIGKLAVIVDSVLGENQRLRLHYYFRNQDVKNLIQSIKMNLHQEVSDIQHQIHLVKEGNFQIFTEIQMEISKNEESNQCVDELNRKLVQLVNESVTLKQTILSSQKIRLSSHLNSSYIKQLQQKQQLLAESEQHHWEEIINLTFEVVELEKTNIKNLRVIQQDNCQNLTNKQDYKVNIIQSLMSLKELKEEKDNLVMRVKKMDATREELLILQKQKYQKYLKEMKAKQKKMSDFNKLLFDRQQIVSSISKTKQKLHELQQEQQKKNDEKQKLLTQIKAKKRVIEQMQQKHNSQKIVLQTTINTNIQDIKLKMKKNQNDYHNETMEITRQKQLDDKNVRMLEEQLKQLKEDEEDYQNIKNKFYNPTKQLEQAQLMLQSKKKNKSQGSMGIFSRIF